VSSTPQAVNDELLDRPDVRVETSVSDGDVDKRDGDEDRAWDGRTQESAGLDMGVVDDARGRGGVSGNDEPRRKKVSWEIWEANSMIYVRYGGSAGGEVLGFMRFDSNLSRSSHDRSLFLASLRWSLDPDSLTVRPGNTAVLSKWLRAKEVPSGSELFGDLVLHEI